MESGDWLIMTTSLIRFDDSFYSSCFSFLNNFISKQPAWNKSNSNCNTYYNNNYDFSLLYCWASAIVCYFKIIRTFCTIIFSCALQTVLDDCAAFSADWIIKYVSLFAYTFLILKLPVILLITSDTIFWSLACGTS